MKFNDKLKFVNKKSGTKTRNKKDSGVSGGKKLLRLILVALLVFLVFVACDVFGWEFQDEKVLVTIPEGCTVKEISAILEEADVVDFAIAFRLYEKIDGVEHLYQQGSHYLNNGMSYRAMMEKMTQKPDVELNKAIKVTIPEGFENRQIADKLAELGLVDREEFIDELENGEFDYWFINEIERTENRLEGYLFPATYEILPGEGEHAIICRMLDSFSEKIVPLFENAQTDMTLDQVVTFASIVEREAANDEERPVVASVFYNRIAKDMSFSSCATVQYILKERKDVLSTEDTKLESPYNTYINKGLPVGPIASPGVNSVKAVLEPAETNYLFFAAKADGSENVFAETDVEHMKNVEELQKQ